MASCCLSRAAKRFNTISLCYDALTRVQFAAEAFSEKDVIEVCFDPERWRMKESSAFQFTICCSTVIMDD